MPDPKRPVLSQWLASNPHRFNLGRIGLVLRKNNGAIAEPDELRSISQTLDLWTGMVTAASS